MSLIRGEQITGSVGTASFAVSASYSENASSSSYAISSSYSDYALSASYAPYIPTLPGGIDNSIQFKNGSEFDGSSNLLFNSNDNILDLTGSIIVSGQITNTSLSGATERILSTTSGELSASLEILELDVALANYTGSITSADLTISQSAVISGSLNVLNSVTASYFSGSFIGNGSNLYNIPASGIVGLNLSQIASGSATASISPDNGLQINVDTVITGSLNVDNIVIGAGSTTVPPIQLTSGDLLNSEIPGAIEFKDDDLYIGISTAPPASYVSQYPPAYSDTYVKATTFYINGPYYNYPHIATNPSNTLIGESADGHEWISSNGTYTNQRFHIDLGTSKAINRIYYENHHRYGFDTTLGVKNFTLWGSNSATAFAELTYGIDTGWTQITGLSQTYFDKHSSADQSDPKYITFPNTTAYRYYALKIADNWAGSNYMAIRRIELQEAMVVYERKGIILNDGNNLSETYFPIATVNGRLIDSGITQSGSLLTISSSLSISASGSLYGSSSYAISSSYASNISGLTSGSFVRTDLTDSSVQDIQGTLKLTGDIIAENYIISSSVLYVTTSYSSGSTHWGDRLDNTHQFTGSVNITGSLTSPSITGSLYGTSSWAINAVTASTADYFVIRNGVEVTGSILSSGSLIHTGSVSISGSLYAQSVETSVLYSTSSFTGSIFVISDNINPIFEVNSDKQVIINGTIGVNSTYNNVVTASMTIASIDINYANSAYINYYVKNTISSARAGDINIVWDSTNYSSSYSETSTTDINGSTEGCSFSASITGSYMNLRAVISSGSWEIKTGIRTL